MKKTTYKILTYLIYNTRLQNKITLPKQIKFTKQTGKKFKCYSTVSYESAAAKHSAAITIMCRYYRGVCY